MPLTPRQKKFADVYAGNATEAARLAGYKGSDATLAQTGSDLLRNPEIAAVIKARESKEVRPLVSTRQQRQAFWSEVMNAKETDMAHRLKASELLGKSEADFTDKLQHSGAVKVRFSIGLTPRKAAT